MAANLTASFILKLEDKLSGGIQALSRKLEALNKLARQISLQGLDGADRALDRVGAATDAAGRGLDRLSAKARAAAAALKQVVMPPIMVNGAGTAFLPPAMMRAAMTATVLAAAAAGGGGRGMPLLPPLRLSAPMLSLAGPGGAGGIPLNYSPYQQGVAAGAALRARVGAGLQGYGANLQGMSGAMGHLGHAGVAAFATSFGLGHPINEYAKYENTLRHIAITANTPMEQLGTTIGGLAKQYDALALASGQSAEKVAESANFLITTGIGKQAVDTLLPLVARAATAYNAPIGDSVQAIFSLKENLHVPDNAMAGTISAMALAGKEGHFSFSDMSRYFPDVAPLAAGAGLGGAGGARELMAMLETSRRNAGTSGEAHTNVRDFLSHLFGDNKRGLGHAFGAHGVDLQKLLLDAEKKGISAPEAVIEQVRRMTQGKTRTQSSLIIGSLFHNQQSASYVRGALADLEYYLKLKEKLRGADAGTIDHDFEKAADAPLVKMRQIEEKLKQIERRVGAGFAPMLQPIDDALGRILAAFTWMDQHMPGTLDKLLMIVGGVLAISAALGLLIPIGGLIGRGFMLLLAPLRLITTAVASLAVAFFGLSWPVLAVIAAVALLALAAYLIWDNWGLLGPFFRQLWADLQDSFWQFVAWVKGLWTSAMDAAGTAIMDAWHGLGTFFVNLWTDIQQAFSDFIAWVTSWVEDKVNGVVEAFKGAWNGIKDFFVSLWAEIRAPFDNFIGGVEARIERLRNSGVGRFLGMGNQAQPSATEAGPPGAGSLPAQQRVRVQIDPIVVQLDQRGAGNLAAALGRTPGARTAPDPGEMAGRD